MEEALNNHLNNRPPRVIVIGAGISGLSAACRLSGCAPSLEVIILEGSERVGGRIMTSEFTPTSEQIELGATWIHGIEGSPIHTIAESSSLLSSSLPFECMDGVPDPPIVVAQGGVTVPPSISTNIAQLYKDLINEVNSARGIPRGTSLLDDGDAPNLGSFLRRRLHKFMRKGLLSEKKNNNAGVSLDYLQEGVFKIQENWERCVTAAESLHDLNLEAFNEYYEFPGEQITIGQGFSSIVNEMAKTLPPGSICFNKLVEQITWSSHASDYPVKVHCQDGTEHQADHVIVTVSLGVLKSRASSLFRPALPPWKMDAIEKLGFGVVDKLFFLMEPLPPGARHPNLQLIHDEESESDEVPAWLRKTHSMYPIHKNSNVLVAWFAGKEAKAMECLSDEEIGKGIQSTLAAFGDKRRVAGVKAVNGRYTNGKVNGVCTSSKVSVARGTWNKNPLFLGSYSYVAVGSSGEDIELLAEPVGGMQVMFAGEATHREQYSTTHGAYFSGVREAERLLKHYKLMSS